MSISLSFPTFNNHRHHKKQPISSHIHYYKLIGVIHLYYTTKSILLICKTNDFSTNLMNSLQRDEYLKHLEGWLMLISLFPFSVPVSVQNKHWLVHITSKSGLVQAKQIIEEQLEQLHAEPSWGKKIKSTVVRRTELRQKKNTRAVRRTKLRQTPPRSAQPQQRRRPGEQDGAHRTGQNLEATPGIGTA
jgi:hypothetical protein